MLVYGFVAEFSYTAGLFAKELEMLLFCDLAFTICMLMAFMFLVFSISEMCMHPFKSIEKQLFVACLCLILIIRWDPLELYLYYFNTNIRNDNGFSYLVKENGPAYYITAIFILFCFYKIFRIIFISLNKQKNVSKKTCRYLIHIALTVCLCYVVSKFWNLKFNLVPLCMPFIEIALIRAFRRISMYDVKAAFVAVFEDIDERCYICFDGKKQYMGCSNICLQKFPKLELLRVDEPVSEIRCPEIAPLIQNLDMLLADEEEHVIEFGVYKDMILSCKAHSIILRKKLIGILVEMTDITKTHQEKEYLDLSNQLLEAELEIQGQKVERIQQSIITGMARMVESRDNSTGGHINRTSAGVRCFIEYIADNYAFPWCTQDFCKNLIEAAPLHDLGKIAVNDVILRKKGKFTDEEFAEMKKHAAEGAKIVPIVLSEVENIEFKLIAENVAHYHHEKWNGMGYPDGLKGDTIPIEARIMALADVFDALVSRRCYKEAFSYDSAFDIIRDSLGTQFDPELGEIFLECRQQMEDLYNSFDLQ